MPNTLIIYGPPGSGKTSALLQHMETFLKKGGSPEDIAFLAYTRRAAKEALDRACECTGLPRQAFPWFRTLHSAGFKLRGLNPDDIVSPSKLEEFGKIIGVPFQPKQFNSLAGTFGGFDTRRALGNRCLDVLNLAHARQQTIEQVWPSLTASNLPNGLQLGLAKHVAEAYALWKKQEALLDFADMLETTAPLPVSLALLDEAQDCSLRQWEMFRAIVRDVPERVIAGDDDQAIFAWSGAAPTRLLSFANPYEVLPFSHRLPQLVKAHADRILQRIRVRQPKTWAARDEPGMFRYAHLEEADLRTGDWMLMARANSQCQRYRMYAHQHGVVYTLPSGRWSWALAPVRAALRYEALRLGRKTLATSRVRGLRRYAPGALEIPKGQRRVTWTDLFPESERGVPWNERLTGMLQRDVYYLTSLLRNKESLTGPGRVRIGTVHSFKGAEADNVVVCPDYSRVVQEGKNRDPDAELRVQYVAATRARQQLLVLHPRRRYHWEF